MTAKLKKIGVLTSGGDSPGMNACIRAVVRSAISDGLEVSGISLGYEGMINGYFRPMRGHDVSGIIQRGGTILRSARSKRFHQAEWRKRAFDNLTREGIEGLVVIGGDGTFTGAQVFGTEFDLPIMGTPGTIDNDLYGTDFTIGYDTALNTALEAIDKIRDTAASHNRLFFVEVMGRDAGFIAMHSGLAGGAEAILIPEHKTDIGKLVEHLKRMRSSHNSAIIVVAEGDDAGGAFEIAKKVGDQFDYYDTRVSVLGHIQRGGTPTCNDRLLGTILGVGAVKALIAGRSAEMVGMQNRRIAYTPFSKAIKEEQKVNPEIQLIADSLSTFY